MHTLVIYHGNCPDGFCAATIAKHELDAAVMHEAHYGAPVPDVTGAVVYLLDFCYDRKTMEAMAEVAEFITVLDHHATAQQDLRDSKLWNAKNVTIVFDMNKSGAMLTWEHFHPGVVAPKFVQYIQDRDLWQWKLPSSREVNTAFWALPKNFDTWMFYIIDGVDSLITAGKIQLLYANALIDQMLTQAAIRLIDGHKVPVVNASVLFSDVCDKLLEVYPDAPFAAYYFDRGTGIRQWGSRARLGFDVSAIATKFGGGGHKAAAGWQESCGNPLPVRV